ncbi:MAG TPA: gamma-glutamyl-phosphate reductase, partial [Alphaproteobacteria bacterium]|nr:gamma-glutamyl-phosphate reductase [Alphaproteobacteria bacterium]
MIAPDSRSVGPDSSIRSLAQAAREGARSLAHVAPERINEILSSIAHGLRAAEPVVLEANGRDMERARQKGLDAALCDRLFLDSGRIEAMARGVEAIRCLADPVGDVLAQWDRPNGLTIQRVRVPIGLLGMIFESRPNVAVDAAALCLKSHNAVLLRGGSESLDSCLALHAILRDSLRTCGLPEACVSMVPTAERERVGEMLAAGDLIDVMIPRGGRGLIERVTREATMPVFAHLDGICHIYIH